MPFLGTSQTTCRQTSLPLAPQYQGTDYTEDIHVEAFSWHPFQFDRRQAVSPCSDSTPQCSTFSSNVSYSTDNRDEPHTGRTALCTWMSVCLLTVWIDKFWMSRFKYFMKDECPRAPQTLVSWQWECQYCVKLLLDCSRGGTDWEWTHLYICKHTWQPTLLSVLKLPQTWTTTDKKSRQLREWEAERDCKDSTWLITSYTAHTAEIEAEA